MKLLRNLLLSGVAFAASIASAATWTIDSRHSAVNFTVRNFFTNVPGAFRIQSGTVDFDPANPSKGSIQAVIEVGSVDTRDADRDKHLRNQDFFETDKFPTATFKSTTWEMVGENKFRVTGDLTIKEVTKPVVLDVSLLGAGPGRGGSTVAGWEATTTLQRKDFGISYGPSIGNEVRLTIAVQSVLKG